MGSEQAREVLAEAYAHFEMHDTAKALLSVDSLNLHQEAAIRAITTAREQALREAAEEAQAYARGPAEQKRHGEAIAAHILSLLTKEPKA